MKYFLYLICHLCNTVENLGVVNTTRYVWQRLRTVLGLGRPTFTLRSRDARFPITIRRGSSDVQVFKQIYIAREYRCLDGLRNVGLVIDCGANIGCSAAYFLSRFPECRVIAIEPDPDNFRLLIENLRPYGGRVECVRSAVWSRPTGLVMNQTKNGPNKEWARQVRECNPGEKPEMTAVDIGTLLARSESDRISILKIDIEGAETVIFADNYANWISRVNTIVIELHRTTEFGDGPSVFFRAIVGRPCAISHCGELTVCQFYPEERSATPLTVPSSFKTDASLVGP